MFFLTLDVFLYGIADEGSGVGSELQGRLFNCLVILWIQPESEPSIRFSILFIVWHGVVHEFVMLRKSKNANMSIIITVTGLSLFVHCILHYSNYLPLRHLFYMTYIECLIVRPFPI